MVCISLLLLGIVLGVALGIRLGIRYSLKEARAEIHEEYERIDRQTEYWDGLQSMYAETAAWTSERDPADWWKRGESTPSWDD